MCFRWEEALKWPNELWPKRKRIPKIMQICMQVAVFLQNLNQYQGKKNLRWNSQLLIKIITMMVKWHPLPICLKNHPVKLLTANCPLLGIETAIYKFSVTSRIGTVVFNLKIDNFRISPPTRLPNNRQKKIGTIVVTKGLLIAACCNYWTKSIELK